MTDANTLRTYANYTFSQLIQLIIDLQAAQVAAEAAEEAAYDQGYEDGLSDAADLHEAGKDI